MYRLQLMSAEDEPLRMMHVSPGQGLCLLGENGRADMDITRRHNNTNYRDGREMVMEEEAADKQ